MDAHPDQPKGGGQRIGAAAGSPDKRRRAHWLKTLHQWHWISAALCLMGMLLFSVTGITLNHAAEIESRPQVTQRQARLPQALGLALQAGGGAEGGSPAAEENAQARNAPLPKALQTWLSTEWKVQVGDREAEWSPEEVYLSLPRPGGDAWVRIDRASGEVEYERTDRGWVSYFNDLHKGRHTGLAWRWFIDIFGAACLVFAVTGLFILKMHAAQRPTTWPIVGLGVLVPLLLALLLIH